jgi:hypothetical protein
MTGEGRGETKGARRERRDARGWMLDAPSARGAGWKVKRLVRFDGALGGTDSYDPFPGRRVVASCASRLDAVEETAAAENPRVGDRVTGFGAPTLAL